MLAGIGGDRTVSRLERMQLLRLLILLLSAVRAQTAAAMQEPAADRLTVVSAETSAGTVKITGRVLVSGAPGWLVEDRAGRLTQIPAAAVRGTEVLDTAWVPLEVAEMSGVLKDSAGAGFEVTESEHFLICSDCSEDYNEFCGKLLDKVFEEYFELMEDLQVGVKRPAVLLPVLIFSNAGRFQSYAEALHPEVSFADTPGFYTVRDNQILLQDFTREVDLRGQAAIRGKLAKQPLQVATMVHETVHQLAFNSGLQVRFADNPVWFSEGLALFFEQTSVRSGLLWTRPGLVNERHHPTFAMLTQSGRLPIGLQQLSEDDTVFSAGETAAAAYAQSWAIMTWLIRREQQAFRDYVSNLQQLQPLQKVPAAERTQRLLDCLPNQGEAAEQDLIRMITRLRVSR